jgi:hypothetical protein
MYTVISQWNVIYEPNGHLPKTCWCVTLTINTKREVGFNLYSEHRVPQQATLTWSNYSTKCGPLWKYLVRLGITRVVRYGSTLWLHKDNRYSPVYETNIEQIDQIITNPHKNNIITIYKRKRGKIKSEKRNALKSNVFLTTRGQHGAHDSRVWSFDPIAWIFIWRQV